MDKAGEEAAPALAVAVRQAGRAASWLRRLATLPSPERDALLIPLLDERGDGQKIVRYLLGARRSAAELVPAVAPTGRGDEATPTG